MLVISQQSSKNKGFIGFKEKERVYMNGNSFYIQAPYSDVGIKVKLEDVLLVSLKS